MLKNPPSAKAKFFHHRCVEKNPSVLTENLSDWRHWLSFARKSRHVSGNGLDSLIIHL